MFLNYTEEYPTYLYKSVLLKIFFFDVRCLRRQGGKYLIIHRPNLTQFSVLVEHRNIRIFPTIVDSLVRRLPFLFTRTNFFFFSPMNRHYKSRFWLFWK